MEQNSIALSNSQYDIITNNFRFDQNQKAWSAKVLGNGYSSKITFNMNLSNDNYAIKYSKPSDGTLTIKKNNVAVTLENGNNKIIAIDDITATYSIEYNRPKNNNSNSGVIVFSVVKLEDYGTGCDNTELDSVIITSNSNSSTSFTTELNSSDVPTTIGYMHGSIFDHSTAYWTSNAKFGSGFTWDGTNYKLVDATVTTPDSTHHYSCNQTNANATCTDLRYVYSYDSNAKYYMILRNGYGIEETIRDMHNNLTNSNAKNEIETWYSNNLINYIYRMEDTIYCNDRTIDNLAGWSPTGRLTVDLSYSARTRARNFLPSLSCTKNDSFTWKNNNGNQQLSYPTGMLSFDEIMLAGGKLNSGENNFYLNSGVMWSSMSPSGISGSPILIFAVNPIGRVYELSVAADSGLRPAISIKPGQLITKGTGTVLDPYVIE